MKNNLPARNIKEHQILLQFISKTLSSSNPP
eukprot:UN17888